MKFAALIIIAMLSYVSSPAHVPNFDNFTTPVLEPGVSGIFNFTIENRYFNSMINCKLSIGIYMWATEEEAKKIWDIKNRPVIRESNDVNYTVSLGNIEPGDKIPVAFYIKSFPDTPDGVYFVRFSLVFTYNGTTYKMWSPGYFPREVWDNATKNHTLDLDYLSSYLGDRVDGIIPDSSFSVKSNLILILYVLGGLSAVVGIAAFYSYFHEEGKIRRGDEYIYQLKGKYKYLEKKVRRKLKERNQ